MNIDLRELTQLPTIFRELLKGYHISRRDPELYSQLSTLQDEYRALFKSLGFELVCDSRGYYYFVPEQMGAQVNKTAQRLSLFTFIVIEHLADQGRDPLAVLDGGSMGRDELLPLLDKYRDLFLQAEISSQEELDEKILRRLTQLGFAAEDNGMLRFLAPMHRFLDVCLAVQQDRDLAASMLSTLPLPTPEPGADAPQADDAFPAISQPIDESDEAALSRAMAEERAAQELDA